MNITIYKDDSDEIIRIQDSDKGGHFYAMYENQKAYDQGNDSDSGLCTGTDLDAIEMAMLQAGAILPCSNFSPVCEHCGDEKNNEDDECADCNTTDTLMIIN
jgi:hypothetical protein